MLFTVLVSLFFIADFALLLIAFKIIGKWITKLYIGQVIKKQKFNNAKILIVCIGFFVIQIFSIIQRGYINSIDIIGILFFLCLLIIGINDSFFYVELRQFGIVTKYNVIDWGYIENIEFGEKMYKAELIYRYVKFNVKWHGIKYSVKVRNLDDSMISHITSKCKVKPKEQA